jgi:hypothetical protein
MYAKEDSTETTSLSFFFFLSFLKNGSVIKTAIEHVVTPPPFRACQVYGRCCLMLGKYIKRIKKGCVCKGDGGPHLHVAGRLPSDLPQLDG